MTHFNEISSLIIPLILAITLHEAAHGFAASRLGDMTAKMMGRVTLNPFKHIDPFGTIILPAALIASGAPAFGWAKPVPVVFSNLRNRRLGTMLVAFAGPLTNILLAFASALMLHIEAFVTPEQAPWMYMNLYNSVNINVLLAVLNMIPILPLDGGRVLGAMLPDKIGRIYAKSERFGLFAILGLFVLSDYLRDAGLVSLHLTHYLLYAPADSLRDVILHLSGIGDTQ